MKLTEDVNCKTQCGDMASWDRSNDTALRHDTDTVTADSLIDSDDITVARIFFLIIVMFVAMVMKETYGAFDEMTKSMC